MRQYLTVQRGRGTLPDRRVAGIVERVMVGRVRALSCLILLAAAVFVASQVQAAGLLEKNFWLEGPRYDAVVPACDDPAALAEIASRFAAKERRFWNSELEILRIDHVREAAFRPWDRDLIPRRFCAARALISDGHARPVYYAIGEDTGIIGATWGVQWCVVGYDRNLAYGPACRMAQP